MSERNEYEYANQIRLLEDALAKLYRNPVGSFQWQEVVHWTVNGILEERLTNLRKKLWLETNGAPEIEPDIKQIPPE